MAQKLLMDTIVATLLLGGLDGIELIETIYLHMPKRHTSLLVATHQLVINT
jgi:hypothetical protein